jgi:hypothetical protein
MAKKADPKLPLHQYIATGGKVANHPTTKGVMPKRGKK